MKCQGALKTTLKVVNEDAKAVQASSLAMTPNQVGVEELQGMLELKEAKPKGALREEPPVAFPLAEATLDLEGMPELEDAGPEESIEEYLANAPPIGESLAQPWVQFEAQVRQDEVQYWAAMFTWFRVMHLSWEESRRRKGDE